MSAILRNPEHFTTETFDAIIIGGGIYGVMLSYEATKRGLKTLLLEKNDFGSSTTYNSLRVVHGGLRYLQSLDLHRFFESVSERHWFMRNFPEFVKPLPCLMPLYGEGIKRLPVFRIALKLNDILSYKRNEGIPGNNSLNSGKVIDFEKTKKIFPLVDTNNLRGGAVWFDASIPDSQLVLLEILKFSVSMGAKALNYFEGKEPTLIDNKVKGIKAIDNITGREYEFNADIVINATGPWSRELAKKIDKDYDELFKASIASNILFNRKALSNYALAVTPKRKGARTYFLHPWKGMLLAGTIHKPWVSKSKDPVPSEESVNEFITDLNNTIPELNLEREDILQIYSGLLPAKKEGDDTLSVRECIINHSKYGGPKGLYSLSGVKLTTSRLVAKKVLDLIFKTNSAVDIQKTESHFKQESKNYKFEFEWDPDKDNRNWKEILRELIDNTSVMHLDDLILRRTTIGDNPISALKAAPEICKLFNWDINKIENEILRLEEYYKKRGLIINKTYS